MIYYMLHIRIGLSLNEKTKKRNFQARWIILRTRTFLCVQERLESLKQSIEFMAALKPGRGSEDGEEQRSSSDPKDRPSPMDTSDNSQSPRVAHRDTPRYRPDT